MNTDYKSIKIIAFDFDGVLVDSMQHNMHITNIVCREFGSQRDVTEDDLQNIARMSFDDIAELIGVPRKNFKPCLVEIDKLILETYDSLFPFSGILDALKELSKTNVSLIIVTHNTQCVVNAFLKKYNIKEYFSLVMGAETKGEKAAKLAAAAGKFNISPEEIIMIGDSAGDITSAIKVKAIPVGVAWGFQKSEKLIGAGAVKILQTPQEIATINYF